MIVRLGFLLSFWSAWAFSAMRVVTSTTDLAWLVSQIGKDAVSVSALLKGPENPHYVDTVPSFIRLAADADVVCMVGLDLEVGWMPKILAKSGNAKVQPGGLGYCEVGKSVSVLEKPKGEVDRSMGDIHPSGNPHFWLSPIALAQGGTEVVRVLSAIAPDRVTGFQSNLQAVQKSLEAFVRTEKPRLPGASVLVAEYHKEFAYFFDVYGLKSFGSLEEKPGVPPSAGRIADFATAAKKAGVRVLLAGESAPKKVLERFTELSGIAVLQVSTSVLAGKDYLEWQKNLLDQVRTAMGGKKG